MFQDEVMKRVYVVGMLLVMTVVAWWPEFGGAKFGQGATLGQIFGQSACPAERLCVAFLNVGQGDSIFIQSPTGGQMLIDGGRDSSVLRELAQVMGFWDKELDYVLATHPDADHVAGLVDVFERYTVDNIIRTENESQTQVWQAVAVAMETEGSPIYYARRGQRYDLGGGVVLEILFPDREMSQAESNTSSIVARLTYGQSSFVFTGDSPKGIEEYLVLTEGENLKSDVLKLGHHGSRTSTSELFLDEVEPEYAVVSAGKDNQYGHPHVEVTDMLFNKRIETLSTAEAGTIIFVSDGEGLVVQ